MKYYQIANLTVEMEPQGRTLKQAMKYEVNQSDKVDFTIIPETKDIRETFPQAEEDTIYYLATERDFYRKLLDYNGIRLHSSAVVISGKAYLFSADSGTGKSTHTKLWLDLFGEDAYILNDDKPALRYEDGRWFAYGTPWSGKYDISENKRVPVGGIAMIERSSQNEIYPFKGTEAIRQILAQTNKPPAMESRIKVMDLLSRLFKEVPIWKLKCNMEKEAAILSYEVMTGKNIEKIMRKFNKGDSANE